MAEPEPRFREDLEVREEVAPEGTDPLPPGVTHTVRRPPTSPGPDGDADEDPDVGDDDEPPAPHRDRFSAT